MSNWCHADVLDNGPAYIKANSTKMLAILTYAAGDSYATVTTAGNIIAEVAMTPADYTLSGSPAAALDRVLTVASGKSDASANNTGDPTHIAHVDVTNAKVLWVHAESGAVTVSAGMPVTFPAPTYTSSQPV